MEASYLWVFWGLLNGFILLPIGAPQGVIIALSGIWLVVILFWSIAISMFPCPRCGNSIYVDYSVTFIPRVYDGRCVHCGLWFGEDPTEPKNGKQAKG
jgi:hypothetical protein